MTGSVKNLFDGFIKDSADHTIDAASRAKMIAERLKAMQSVEARNRRPIYQELIRQFEKGEWNDLLK